ncbi:MAG: heme-copper oxidase subunit III [Euryarchaeota archaeon]|nr:heme-copper oxidase subunit III [Euryarchaeota archaeon]
MSDEGGVQFSAGMDHHRSKWPILVGLALTLFLIGVLVRPILILGAVALLGSVYGWLREDVRTLPLPTAARSDRYIAVVVLVLGEVFLFGAGFFYFFWARAHVAPWPPEGVDLRLGFVLVNSVLLFSSAATAHWAQRALEKGRDRAFRMHMASTVLLGTVFLGGQGYEYLTAGFTPASHPYGSAFFGLTGLHGLHVLAGLVVLAVLTILSKRGLVNQARASGVSAAILYWHFVDAVWAGILATIYLRWI